MQVNRRRLALSAALLLTAAPALAASHKPAPEPVYRVDSVTTRTEAGKLVVTAHGAVSSGGWTNPQLRPRSSRDLHNLTFEFVAVPPPPDAAVIEALVPIEARTTARPSARATAIRVTAESNDTTIPLQPPSPVEGQ